MITTLTVRRADVSDADAITQFATRTFREAFGEMVPAASMQAYLNDAFALDRVTTELSDPDSVFLLATDTDDTIAGYAKLYFCAPLPEVVGEKPVKLWRLYTAREWQSKGVGSLLMQECVHVARDRGGATLWLTVNTGNTGAIRFYERYGFASTGFTSFNLGNEVHRDHVMERAL